MSHGGITNGLRDALSCLSPYVALRLWIHRGAYWAIEGLGEAAEVAQRNVHAEG